MVSDRREGDRIRRGQLANDAIPTISHSDDIPRPIHGNTGRSTEGSTWGGPGRVATDAAGQRRDITGGIDHPDCLVEGVGDIDIVRSIHGHSSRSEEGGIRSDAILKPDIRASGKGRDIRGTVDLSDHIVQVIGYKKISSPIQGYSRGGIESCIRSASIGNSSTTFTRKGRHRSARRNQPDAIVPLISHIDIVRSIHGHSSWAVESGIGSHPVRKTLRPDACKSRDHPVRCDGSDGMVAIISHIESPTTRNGNPIRFVKGGSSSASITESRGPATSKG